MDLCNTMTSSETLEHIKKIIKEGIDTPEDEDEGVRAHLERFSCVHYLRRQTRMSWEEEGERECREERRKKDLISICNRLFEATAPIEGHFKRLDNILSDLYTFRIHLREEQSIESIAKDSLGFLKRLPDQPLGLPGLTSLPDSYFVDELRDGTVRKTVEWPCLKVTTNYSTNVLRAVLCRAVHSDLDEDGAQRTAEKQLVDLTADLLHTCCKIEGSDETDQDNVRERWLVVRIFLWASWQRMQLLYFYRTLAFRLSQGFDTDLGSFTVLRNSLVAPDMTIQQFSDKVAFNGKPPYMCTWAFNLLRTEGIAIGSDFRLLHERYNQMHGGQQGRCKDSANESCDGSQMGDCRRFSRSVRDQSMHDEACPSTCHSLVWDEESYRSVKGGRAVDIAHTDFEKRLLRYKAVSENTMAISHAWAHGQGGRPSTGFNECLHILYTHIAQKLGCDSYFLDTTCIPETHDLRGEAIRNINDTFRRSKVTLVIDRDVMSTEDPKNEIELQECMLATILLSDWNIRAWTLLEAMKGRRNIRFLCKDRITVDYGGLVQAIVGHGRIDIAIFALLAPHLLSWKVGGSDHRNEPVLRNPSLEIAGMLLSYRPASRDGDELVIWSLMINRTETEIGDAKDFWTTQVGKSVATGFLVSSAERVGKDKLSWAPATPYAAPKEDSLPPSGPKKNKNTQKFYRAFAGEETEYAHIREDGIFAHWLVHKFQTPMLWTVTGGYWHRLRQNSFSWKRIEPDVTSQLFLIRLRFLRGFRRGALVQPKIRQGSKKWSMHQFIPEYSGGAKGTLLVVLGCRKSESTRSRKGDCMQLEKWEWRGVFEWPTDVELPDFVSQELWIA